MLRTALLDGVINLDKDYSKFIESIATPGIISGLDIVSGTLKAGKAWIQVTRTGIGTFYCYVENTADKTIDTTGTKKVWLEVKQSAIDNSLSNNEDGSSIVDLKTGSTYPTMNYIPLASINSGTITDERTYCKVKNDKYIFSKMMSELSDVLINSLTTGQTLVWNGTKWINQSPTIDINGLQEILTFSSTYYGVLFNGVGNYKFSFDTLKRELYKLAGFGGDGSDLNVTSGLTITGSSNSYIVKNYNNFTPGNNVITITPNGCILHLKIKGNCDLTNVTFNFSGKGGQYGDEITNGVGTSFMNAIDLLGNTGHRRLGGQPFPFLRTNSKALKRNLFIVPGQPGFKGSGSGGGNGGAGGGALILEVSGNLIFNNTVLNFAGSSGSNGSSPGAGGGGGGGGMFLGFYLGTLSGSPTFNGNGGSGGSGSNDNQTSGGGGGSGVNRGNDGVSAIQAGGGAGGNGVYLVEKWDI